MIRPTGFAVNAETAADNAFQGEGSPGDRDGALAEFDAMVAALREAGVAVVVFDQARADTPDAVFPNNWLTTHADGLVVTYPMRAPSRRLERRGDVVDALLHDHGFTDHLDLSGEESEDRFLEGTGAVVFDHRQRLAYCARSPRSDEAVLATLCARLGYETVGFGAADADGVPIYHTNVMMAVGGSASFACLEAIADEAAREAVRERLKRAGTLLIELTLAQVAEFAGNSLEVEGEGGPVLVISAGGWRALTDAQKGGLPPGLRIVAPGLPTIEKSGGSARCMMAGLFPPRPR